MMANKGGGDTINRGPTPKRHDRREEFDIAGNARTRGEDPSPDDRERGETSRRDQSDETRKAAR
jgi:hypothetical protein